MTSSSCASEVSGEGGKRKERARWKKKFLAFLVGSFFPPPPSFFLAPADTCELISFTCMNFITRASPRSGQGSVGWMGVRSSVWGGCWNGKGKLKGEKRLGDFRKKGEDGTIGRAPWIYLAAWDTAGRLQRLYQCRTRAGISNETICNLQKMHPKPQAKKYSKFEHS